MSAEYRQKLLNFFCSALLVSLVTALCLVAMWFVDRPWELAGWRDEPPTIRHFGDYAGTVGEYLLFFPILLVPTLIWHMFDLLQRSEPEGGFAAHFSSVRTWWIVIGLLGLTLVLSSTGHFTYTAPCGGGFVFLWQDCYYTKGVVWIPLIILLLFAPILCMGKAAISIRSLIKKAP